MSNLRRYEILLPRRFNDGQPVRDSLISQTLDELEERFGAVSWETQVIRGAGRGEGERFQDELFRVFVDVEDRPENREFFRHYKERLKTRFQQREIWMTTHLIDSV